MKNDLEVLAKYVEEEKAKEILRLTENYDKYILKFKKQLNSLISPIGYEVKVGIAFKQLGDSNGSDK